jgi:hypothetical protein
MFKNKSHDLNLFYLYLEKIIIIIIITGVGKQCDGLK